MTKTVLIVGTGLLGTSAGLALSRAGWQVHLSDINERSSRLAASLGAGSDREPAEHPAVVLVAVPPSAVPLVLHDLRSLYPTSIFSDVASVKTYVQLEAERLGLADRFVGGHPMAGRERGGTSGARADLFEGRVWAVCPTASVDPSSVLLVTHLASDCGAIPVEIPAAEHDRSMAVVSHGPQLVASAMAARLENATEGALALAGPGLRDTVRIAASDPDLWLDIIASNPTPVADVLEAVCADLGQVAKLLRNKVDKTLNSQEDVSTNIGPGSLDPLRSLLSRGRAGHLLIPGKHGRPAVRYAVVPVVVPDEPGALARIFAAAGEAGVNIEDISIEHSPGQPVGLVEIAVLPTAVDVLSTALSAQGWSVH